METENGMVCLDSPFGKELGFTSDKFDASSYLWKQGQRVVISFIWSKDQGKGNLTRLFSNIEGKGLAVAVPTPLGRMQSILEHKGFSPCVEPDEIMGEVTVWMKPQTNPSPAPR